MGTRGRRAQRVIVDEAAGIGTQIHEAIERIPLETVATSGDTKPKPRTHVLTYRGDVRSGLQAVIGGRWMVLTKDYDADANKTRVKVAKLVDPMAMLLGQEDLP